MVSDKILKKYPSVIESFETINEYLPKLTKRKVVYMDRAKDKISIECLWYLKLYEQIALCRVVDLSVEVCKAINEGKICIAFILTRSIQENLAYLFDLILQIEKLSEKADFDGIKIITTDLLFGSRKTEGLPKIKNILSVIKNTDNLLTGFEETYKIFSEYNHPNHYGMMDLYCSYDADKFLAKIDPHVGTSEKNVRAVLLGLAPSLMLMNEILDELEKKYSKISDKFIQS